MVNVPSSIRHGTLIFLVPFLDEDTAAFLVLPVVELRPAIRAPHLKVESVVHLPLNEPDRLAMAATALAFVEQVVNQGQLHEHVLRGRSFEGEHRLVVWQSPAYVHFGFLW